MVFFLLSGVTFSWATQDPPVRGGGGPRKVSHYAPSHPPRLQGNQEFYPADLDESQEWRESGDPACAAVQAPPLVFQLPDRRVTWTPRPVSAFLLAAAALSFGPIKVQRLREAITVTLVFLISRVHGFERMNCKDKETRGAEGSPDTFTFIYNVHLFDLTKREDVHRWMQMYPTLV